MDSFIDKLDNKELKVLADLKSAELLNVFTQLNPKISEIKRKESSFRTQEKFSIEKILSENKLSYKSRLVRFILFCLRKFEKFGPESLSGINHKIMYTLAPSLVHCIEKNYSENSDIYSAEIYNDVLNYVGKFMKEKEKSPGQYMAHFLDK